MHPRTKGTALQRIEEWQDVDRGIFENEILPANRPALLKGLLRNWPPDQVGNLYIGPLLKTPGGPPISTVDLRAPDHERFPRFAQALESGQQAVLEPGDAIYIPILWWHGVESLDPLNILVNYWWI